MGAEGSIGANLALIKNENDNFFSQNKIIAAGKIKVKHPLMGEEMIVIGCVIENAYMNQDSFIVRGLEIAYRDNEKNSYRDGYKIYPNIIFDNKELHSSIYFRETPLRFRKKNGDEEWYFVDGKYWEYEDGDGDCLEQPNFNYYLFEHTFDKIPECAADVIFAVCKYRENGNFKHAIFSFHELIPVENQ